MLRLPYGETQDFASVILEHLRTSGVQQAHKEDRIVFSSITPWPGDLVCAEGRYVERGEEASAEKRAAIFIGPEFGTVARPDLVAAAREAADVGFDVLIACAFNYEAHASEFRKLGRVPILKARMNADLHMAGDLKNTGKGNLFVIFGDAQRRFRVMANAEELRQALDHAWDKWIVFLHPAQRQIVERDYNGPARVAGSAGTGKTVVALHRAVHLARTHRDARILLATFSEALAAVLQVRLTRLISNEPRLAERLEVHSMRGIARRLYEANLGTPKLIAADEVRELLDQAASEVEGHRFSSTFVWTEWTKVVDAWQLETWEDYRDVARLGRKTRLAEKQRAVLWSIFLKVREALAERELFTECGMFRRLEHHLSKARHTPFEYCVIDEAQDVGVAELRLLSVLGGDRPNGLFFAGDLGQRIFQTPFSWGSLGVDVRGRSQILRVNYRTSHQIRRQADRLLPSTLDDVDGVTEQRGGTISVFNGPEPLVRVLASAEEESACVAEWLRARQNEGYEPHEIGVFVRSGAELERAIKGIEDAGLSAVHLSTHPGGVSGSVAAGTMHLAKGLEFRAVVVAACDDEVLPLQSRIENIADESDLEEVYETERHLLYVACTRARDRLLVTGVDPASEFLDDLHVLT